MANMSYCRFQNTAVDFDDCMTALEECEGGDNDEQFDNSPNGDAEARGLISIVESAASLLEMISAATASEVEDIIEQPEKYAKQFLRSIRS